MFETIAFLITAYVLTWPALVLLLLVGIAFEHCGARKWAVFTGIVAIAVSYFYFNVSLTQILYAVAAYVAVGVVWSFWRYKVYVTDQVAKIKELSAKAFSADSRNRMIENLAPTKNLGMITAWIIIWPFSAVESILGDVIRAVQALVTKVFKGVYHKIYTSQVKGLSFED